MRRILLVLIVAASSRARAQPAGAQAEALFRQGRELLAAGKTAEACGAFDESQRLEPAPTTLLNLAACREKNGQLATAWGLFLEAERQTRNATDPTGQQLHSVATEKAKKLESRVSKLAINVPQTSQVESLEIDRDKDRIEPAMWNRALPIDSGTYTITAHAPGTSTWSTKVTISEAGDSKTVDVPVVSALPVATSISAKSNVVEVPVSEPRSNLVPLVVGIGSLALLGGALGFDLWGNSTYDSAKAEMADQARRDSLETSANHKRYAAEGLAVGGIAAAGVAILLYLRGGDESAPVQASHLRVSPNGFAFAGGF
jgi:hypothetical protein